MDILRIIFGRKSWKESVHQADKIWTQVKYHLAANGVEDLPKTPRRPDIRIILRNTTENTIIFPNPGGHSKGKAQTIQPGEAAMVMLKGDNLNTQYANAHDIVMHLDLGKKGLTQDFIQRLRSNDFSDLIEEVYGPAPFEKECGRLEPIHWTNADGNITEINEVLEENAAYGAREATKETAFQVAFKVFVKGTQTTPEQSEPGIVIAVNKDWETQIESTRPIVASIAEGFYGEYYADMPVVTVDNNGNVLSIELNDSTIIKNKRFKSPTSKKTYG